MEIWNIVIFSTPHELFVLYMYWPKENILKQMGYKYYSIDLNRNLNSFRIISIIARLESPQPSNSGTTRM